MKLEPLMTLHSDLKKMLPVEIGTGPYGTRLVFNGTGGTFEGSRLRGTILPSGGDWLLIDAEGLGTSMPASSSKRMTAHAYMSNIMAWS